MKLSEAIVLSIGAVKEIRSNFFIPMGHAAVPSGLHYIPLACGRTFLARMSMGSSIVARLSDSGPGQRQ